MIDVEHGYGWKEGWGGWQSAVVLVGDEGVWVDWRYVGGGPDLLFVPHGEYEILPPN